MENACQLWHAGLNGHQEEILEAVQKRVLGMAYPTLSYTCREVLGEAKTSSLFDRRVTLCTRLFQDAQASDHKLFPLLPSATNLQSQTTML